MLKRAAEHRLPVGERLSMLVEDTMRRCVLHLFIDEIDATTGTDCRLPVGTAFMVSWPLWADAGNVWYIVTARHVVEDTRRCLDPTLHVRINLTAGGFRDVPTNAHSDWVFHEETDIAVSRLKLVDRYDLGGIQKDWFVTDDLQHKIRPGDEVALIGLFEPLPGRGRNQPIVRFGRIALMPHEAIEVKLGKLGPHKEIEAYLVEMHVWGGSSGSPVFLYWPANREWEQDEDRELNRGPWLLGLNHGHFERSESIRSRSSDQFMDDLTVSMNAGLAIITPAQKIVEVMMYPELKEERDAIRMKRVGVGKLPIDNI